MPALRSLVIECDPYFNLGSFSHNTGAHMASLPISWLACFPNLERLVCDYLKVEASDIDAEACDETTDSEDEVVWLDRNVELDAPETTTRRAAGSTANSAANSAGSIASIQGDGEVVVEAAEDAGGASDGASSASRGRLPVVPLELPLAALSPRGREERGPQPGSQSAGQSGQSARSSCSAEELPPLQKLRDLSFVAVVRGSGSTWHSAHCRCDLSVLARLAPGLQRLFVRSPNIALGRMSRRPGQRIEGLIRVSRHFCSTGLRDMLAVGYLLPSLRYLKVEVAKDDTGNSWDSSGSLLTVPASSKPLHASHLALLLAVHDRPFFLSVGTSDALAAKLRRASSAAASPAAVSIFQNFAVAEQHLPLLQCLQRFQEPKDQKESKDLQLQEFEVDIVEAA
eukprot:s790_g23.t1